MTNVAEGFTPDVGNSRPDDSRRGHVPGDLSMWFFVIGDLLIFGVYFVGYMYFRGQNHELFLQSQARLNLDIGAVNRADAYGAKLAETWDFSKEDQIDDLIFNEVIWRSVRGADSPMPPPVRAAFVFPHLPKE